MNKFYIVLFVISIAKPLLEAFNQALDSVLKILEIHSKIKNNRR